jgi:xylulokinase
MPLDGQILIITVLTVISQFVFSSEMAKEPLVMGIDCGTESARVGLFTTKGKLVATYACPYKRGTQFPKNGYAEQHPHDWWDAVGQASRETIRSLSTTGYGVENIKAIGIDILIPKVTVYF